MTWAHRHFKNTSQLKFPNKDDRVPSVPDETLRPSVNTRYRNSVREMKCNPPPPRNPPANYVAHVE